MPVNKAYNLTELIEAAKEYVRKTGRRVTYEYILIKDLNDMDASAVALAGLLRGQLASVNLIPINPVAERDFQRPSQERIDAFADCLTRHHITVTVRREMGRDIQAACGQLRNKYLVP